ncbi:hypothetical protein L6V77_35750, partial [Myxococcota bacterium]|nr:hypothetical protein [Myxococcota bacterium]
MRIHFPVLAVFCAVSSLSACLPAETSSSETDGGVSPAPIGGEAGGGGGAPTGGGPGPSGGAGVGGGGVGGEGLGPDAAMSGGTG